MREQLEDFKDSYRFLIHYESFYRLIKGALKNPEELEHSVKYFIANLEKEVTDLEERLKKLKEKGQ